MKPNFEQGDYVRVAIPCSGDDHNGVERHIPAGSIARVVRVTCNEHQYWSVDLHWPCQVVNTFDQDEFVHLTKVEDADVILIERSEIEGYRRLHDELSLMLEGDKPLDTTRLADLLAGETVPEQTVSKLEFWGHQITIIRSELGMRPVVRADGYSWATADNCDDDEAIAENYLLASRIEPIDDDED